MQKFISFKLGLGQKRRFLYNLDKKVKLLCYNGCAKKVSYVNFDFLISIPVDPKVKKRTVFKIGAFLYGWLVRSCHD